MKYAVFAWLEFIIGVIILCAYDYYIRWRDGWLGHHGMPTPNTVWFGVSLLLGVIAVLLLWRSTATFSRLRIRIIAVTIQVIIGFVVYFFMCLWYYIETEIDSL